jgi:acetylornithine deacetylase/succinyl-diaminopimelate desuccinylase-like protein
MTTGAVADHGPTVTDVLEMLSGLPGQAGTERQAAEALESLLRTWGCEDVILQPVAERRANVLAREVGRERSQPSVWFYTHLETSLSGDPDLDLPLTGVDEMPPALHIDREGVIRGLGLAVSRGPLAAATAAFRSIADLVRSGKVQGEVGLLLTAGGTHRVPSGGFRAVLPEGLDQGLGIGVVAALGTSSHPDCVINVKGGADGVLSAEPGCLILRLEVRDDALPVPVRGESPGAVVRAARVAQLVEAWRPLYQSAHASIDAQTAPDLGVGAIESGLPYKPDFVVGLGNVYVYLATATGSDHEAIVVDLLAYLRSELSKEDPSYDVSRLDAHIIGQHPGAGTSEGAEIVAIARESWDRRHGKGSSHVSAYRGSTDGVIFRAAGIDTVRFGPTATSDPACPTAEQIELSELCEFADLYVEVATRFLGEGQ